MSRPKGFKLTEEHKKKISSANKGKLSTFKGKHHTPEALQKMSKAKKGKPCTNETKQKISNTLKGTHISDETRKKLSTNHSGGLKKGCVSTETKQKMSKAKKGKPSTFKGKHHSNETKQKISLSKIGQFSGENHPNWLGGISTFPYPFKWNNKLRNQIRERDNYTCQECGLKQEALSGRHKKLSVHHIDYNKDNLNPSNLISLCLPCHSKTNYTREDWIKYFQSKLRQ
jgi:hypothetical protein